jgi:SAM-dependent methyltransferase
MRTYVFDAEWHREHDRLQALGSMFDGASARYLAGLGVTTGWRCLEVGCGAGGLARWLARQVGSTGHVLATDLDCRFAGTGGHGNIEAREHDIVADPLDDGSFDLAHARAVVEHIPDCRRALDRMAGAVRPGGWLLIEDVDFGGTMASALSRYCYPPENAALADRMYRAIDAVFSAAGGDGSFGAKLPGALKESGLQRVGAEAHTVIVPGGTDAWTIGTVDQLAGFMPGTGLVTAAEVKRFQALIADESVHYAPPIMVTAWGQRPPAWMPAG